MHCCEYFSRKAFKKPFWNGQRFSSPSIFLPCFLFVLAILSKRQQAEKNKNGVTKLKWPSFVLSNIFFRFALFVKIIIIANNWNKRKANKQKENPARELRPQGAWFSGLQSSPLIRRCSQFCPNLLFFSVRVLIWNKFLGQNLTQLFANNFPFLESACPQSDQKRFFDIFFVTD